MLASSTYLPPFDDIKESVIHPARERGAGLLGCSDDFLGMLFPVSHKHHLEHWRYCISVHAKPKCFFCLLFLLLPPYQRKGQSFELTPTSNPLSCMKSDQRGMSYLWQLVLVLFSYSSDLNCSFSLSYFHLNLWPCGAELVCESISA